MNKENYEQIQRTTRGIKVATTETRMLSGILRVSRRDHMQNEEV